MVKETVDSAVNQVGSRLLYGVDLRAEITAHPGLTEVGEHLELLDTLDALRCERDKPLAPHTYVFIIVV